MNNQTRILFPFVGGDIIGGSHHSALRMIAGLDPARFQPDLILHGSPGRLGQMITDMGLDYAVIHRPGIVAPRYSRDASNVSRLGYAFSSLPQMVRLLRRRNIAMVHTNDGRMHGNWALPARLAGCRMIWHHRQSPDAFGVNMIAPLLASRIISVSYFSRPARPVRAIDSRFRVIRSPFDLPDRRPDRAASGKALRGQLGLDPQAVVLGYFGALNGRKRPLHFVRAVAAIAAAMPERDIHGAIFGQPELPDDPVTQDCAALARDLGIAGRLHLMGHVSPVEPALAGVDALLVTALEEPFGRTLIEAMHLGTPVIATDHGGNPEAIRDGETGFLVDAEDPAVFAPPLRRLLTEDDLRRKITTAAATGLDRFGTPAHLRQIEALYQELIDETARKRPA